MSDTIKSNDLQFIPTETLINELMNRCDVAVFMGRKNDGKATGDVRYWEYTGHPISCYAQAHEMAIQVQMDMIRHAIKDGD